MLDTRQDHELDGEGAALDFSRTGPDTLAGRYLRRFWIPFAVLDDVKPGRARTVHVLSEAFTYYRGADGGPHLIAANCAHRGTLLATGWVEGDCIRCFYHGWKYDSTGQCVEQPAEQSEFASKVMIAGYPTREYLGLVFAYFGSGEPPAFPHLAAFDQPGFIEARSYTRLTNFFNQLENSVDQVHINFVHRRSGFDAQGSNREIPVVTGEETAYGIFRDHRYSDGKRRIGHILMPVAMFTKVYDEDRGWTDHLAWRVPLDDTRHTSFIVDRIEKSGAELDAYHAARQERERQLREMPRSEDLVNAILRGDLHVDEVDMAHPNLLSIQDDVALGAQAPLHQRPPDRLGRSDVQVILLRKIWARDLRALAAGAPLKNWMWPADLTVTSGV
jgi:5,5'-dehydrodivanillate O-demethylase